MLAVTASFLFFNVALGKAPKTSKRRADRLFAEMLFLRPDPDLGVGGDPIVKNGAKNAQKD